MVSLTNNVQQGQTDWKALRKLGLDHPRIIAIQAREDLSMLFDLLEEFSDGLVLHTNLIRFKSIVQDWMFSELSIRLR